MENLSHESVFVFYRLLSLAGSGKRILFDT
jgi:hypothetical protein